MRRNAHCKDLTPPECNPPPSDDDIPEDRIPSGKHVQSGCPQRFTLVSDLGLPCHVDTDLVSESAKRSSEMQDMTL